jgi:hypothetical protein
MTPSQLNTDSTPRPEPFRWTRPDLVQALHDSQQEASSQRQFAAQHDVPRSTLQHWRARQARLDSDPAVATFLESPAGLAFLHRLVLAARLVFTQQGPCGLRLLSHFLRLSHLDRFVAASYGSQQQAAVALEQAVLRFADAQRTRLAAGMPPQAISVCQDETFHPQTCLVAIEPVSNFLLLETYAEHRDAATWTAAMRGALQGLPVTVTQAISDEAKGLLAHAREGLGVPHAPDLFHVQQELCRGTAPVLAAQTRQEQQRLTDAQARLADLRRQQHEAAQQPRPPGRPIDYPMWIREAEHAATWAAQRVATALERQERMRAAIRGLGTDYHPFDVTTAAPQDATQVRQRLEARFAAIEQLAEEAKLPEHSRARIAKARRVLDGLVAAVAFFWLRVQGVVQGWPLPLVEVWRGRLLAGWYLRQVAGKVAGAAPRAAVRALAEGCLARARAPARLAVGVWAEAQAAARRAAGWFQRSSSCVEGRNGQLELRHHSLHRLSRRKLAVLTALHNYWVKRADGTTAAERFFGSKPEDLFEWLLEQLDMPARPARRRVQAA